MRHTAHVLIHGHPPAGLVRIERTVVLARVEVPQEVPRRVDEGVHRVRVAPGRGTAPRASHHSPALRRTQRRSTLGLEVQPFAARQAHGQVRQRHRHLATGRAVDDGDRRAPVALAGDQPVPQPVGDRSPASAALGEHGQHALDRVGLVQPVQRPGIDVQAVVGGRLAGLPRVGVGGHDDPHRQVERAGEVEVALVVGRHRHDRARAVVSQHVVGGIDRDRLAVDGVDGVAVQEHPGLGPVGGQPVDVGRGSNLLEIGGEVGLGRRAGSQLGGEVAVRRHHEERRAVEGVRAGGEHRHRLCPTLDRELHLGTSGAADPVALHAQDLVRPGALKLRHVVQQPVGVVGDPQVPLGQLALGHQRVAAFAATVDHLLVGQDGLAVGAPVDVGRLAVGQAAVVHLQEEPLVPVVVLGVAGVEGAVPVEGAGITAHGGPLGGDVLVGPGGWVHPTLDRRVLGRQAEGVPADGVQHIESPLHPEAGQDVAERVRLGVTHVQVAGGVREHVEDVLGGARVAGGAGAEGGDLVPHRQPALLDGVRVVGVGGRRIGVGVGSHSPFRLLAGDAGR